MAELCFTHGSTQVSHKHPVALVTPEARCADDLWGDTGSRMWSTGWSVLFLENLVLLTAGDDGAVATQ